MKIYTRTGDDGETGLVGGSRTSKTDIRIQAIGDVDELNAAIGLVRAEQSLPQIDPTLAWLQSALFDLGAELASLPGARITFQILSEDAPKRLETDIDDQTAELPPLRTFILPGGSRLASQLHVARAVCRRAERSVLALHQEQALRPVLLAFLNRVSDWLVVAARTATRPERREDVPWKGS